MPNVCCSTLGQVVTRNVVGVCVQYQLHTVCCGLDDAPMNIHATMETLTELLTNISCVNVQLEFSKTSTQLKGKFSAKITIF